jgi:hypothetical protein
LSRSLATKQWPPPQGESRWWTISLLPSPPLPAVTPRPGNGGVPLPSRRPGARLPPSIRPHRPSAAARPGAGVAWEGARPSPSRGRPRPGARERPPRSPLGPRGPRAGTGDVGGRWRDRGGALPIAPAGPLPSVPGRDGRGSRGRTPRPASFFPSKKKPYHKKLALVEWLKVKALTSSPVLQKKKERKNESVSYRKQVKCPGGMGNLWQYAHSLSWNSGSPLKIIVSSWVLQAHPCNPGDSGGSDQGDQGSKTAQANGSRDSILKIPITKRG